MKVAELREFSKLEKFSMEITWEHMGINRNI